MATRITAITLSGGTDYQHITKLWWMNGSTETYSTREQMVSHIENGGVVYTEKNGDRAYCEVINPSNGAKYVRTKPDSTTGNNLLSLPRK